MPKTKRAEYDMWVLWDGRLNKPRFNEGLGESEDELRKVFGLSLDKWPRYLREFGHRVQPATVVVEVPDE